MDRQNLVRLVGTIAIVLVMAVLLISPVQATWPGAAKSSGSVTAPAELRQATGKLTLLRVHDVGTGFGPPEDFIDVEVVFRLDSSPGQAFGFQLREGANLAARQGMLDLLRDAFNNNWTVTTDYNIDPGKNNGVSIRVWLTK